ncbi:hypothetical protein [Stenotrophomonas sp.]|uniref:hypothetical protein n=1 Tax=Stenotrophomonas sp. TaxID=69392 RepID=UPI0028A1FBB2|nr:hypothetical protein [Stenotrophomonas sp.]
MQARRYARVSRCATAVASALACLLPLQSGAQQAAATDIPYATPDAALTALRALPQVRERQDNDWVVLHDLQGQVFWSVTLPGNGWHPSIVRRQLREQQGEVRVDMQVRCGAAKDDCDRLVQVFQASNENLRAAARSLTESPDKD